MKILICVFVMMVWVGAALGFLLNKERKCGDVDSWDVARSAVVAPALLAAVLVNPDMSYCREETQP